MPIDLNRTFNPLHKYTFDVRVCGLYWLCNGHINVTTL